MGFRSIHSRVFTVFLGIVMSVMLQAPLINLAFAEDGTGGTEAQFNNLDATPEGQSPDSTPEVHSLLDNPQTESADANLDEGEAPSALEHPTGLEAEATEQETVKPRVSMDDPDELLEDYIGVVTAEVAQDYETVSAPSMGKVILANTRGARLTGAEKKAYDLLRDFVAQVAAGDEEIETTSITLTFDQLFSEDVLNARYTTEDLDVAAIVANNEITEEAEDAVGERYVLNTDAILKALLYDCPYTLYWFDKTTGIASTKKWTTGAECPDGKWQAYCGGASSFFTFYFAVSQDYAANPSNAYPFNGIPKPIQTDSGKAQSIEDAVQYAADIVANAAENQATDLAKLTDYKKTICDEVSYNDDAAKNESTPYGDPWQLIYAFDKDPNTNIVCEGYSKAFKYLCDLTTSFDDPTLDCYMVTGVMEGGKGAGRHMWNLVSTDGNNYLVDVTNCDDGTIGSPDKLFMKGNANKEIVSVSAQANGAGQALNAERYTFSLSSSISYTYDYSTVCTYPENERLLAVSDYKQAITGAKITGITNRTYNGKAQTQSPTIQINNVTLVNGTDYTLSYSNNTDAGTATMTITGKGNYNGVVKKAFKINPAKVAVPSAKTNLVYNGKAQTGVSANGNYTVTGGIATNAGSYTATAKLKDASNYTWSDGTTAAKKLTWKIGAASLAKASVTGVANKTYNGKAQTQKPVVKLTIGGKTVTLKAGTDYTVSYLNAKKQAVSASSVKASGTYYVKITGKGNYNGVVQKAFKINKAKQPMVAKAVAQTASAKNLKSKAQVVAKGITVTKAQGKITYAKVAKGSAKCLTINKTTGKITVAKGTKAGTYKINVAVTAAGNANYNKGSKTVTVTIRVK